MKKVFIDGGNGTTGLQIDARLEAREDIELLTLPEELRKDVAARKEMLNAADIAFLCLPDGAAKEAVSMIENPDVCVIDASTAHRTDEAWAYGFPELGKEFYEKIKNSRRIAVPGCHASGFIALVYPLVERGLLSPSAQLTCTSLTGYSGGGKKMIAEYEGADREYLLNMPRVYGISQQHKHLAEMKSVCGLKSPPAFIPVVCDYYSGMEVCVPLFKDQLAGGAEDIKAVYKELYGGGTVFYAEESEGGFLSAGRLTGRDTMAVGVFGNEERILLAARYDNLGKGASGAAVECMNIKLGAPTTKALVL